MRYTQIPFETVPTPLPVDFRGHMHQDICRRCGHPFTSKRADRVYCSDRCRYLDWHDRSHATRACYYCRAPADITDHVPPQSARPRIRELGLTVKFPEIEIPACHECNLLLDARALWTLELRKRFIKGALAKRYAKYLRMPTWSDRELSELGPLLKSSVLGALMMKMIIEERLKG